MPFQISQVTIADSGEYTCVANSDIGGVVTKATLSVLDRPDPPCKPEVKTQVGTSVHLEWQPPATMPTGQIQVRCLKLLDIPERFDFVRDI
jgi:hypothetical protein